MKIEEPPPLRILYLEDDPLDRELVSEKLAVEGIHSTFIFAKTAEEYVHALSTSELDIIFCDYSLPSYDGMTALKEACQRQPMTPFIFISGTIGEERAVEGLRSGATDYVIKDRLDRLVPVVRRALKEAELRREREQAEQALKASEQRYRTLVDMAPEAILTHHEGVIQFVNSAGVALFGGARPEDLLGKHISELSPPHVSGGANGNDTDTSTESALLPLFEQRFIRLDGSTVEAEVRSAFIKSGDKQVTQMLLRDISERKRAEREIRRLNRIYAVLSNINQAIVRVKDLATLFARACEIAVGDGRFQTACIAMIHEESGRLKVLAKAGGDKSCLEGLRLIIEDTPGRRGALETVIREGRHIVCNDLETEPGCFSGRDDGLTSKHRSAACLPFLVNGRVVGSFILFSKTAGFFNVQEMQLLDELAIDLSFAIGFVQQEEKRRAAEAALTEKDRALSTLLGNLPGMAYRCRNDQHWTMEFVSNGSIGLTGFTPEDFTLTRRIRYRDLIHPEDRATVWEEVQHAILSRQKYQLVYRLRTAEAAEKWVAEQGLGVFGVDGELVALEGFVTDITDRKRAHDSLEESEQHWRILFEYAPDAYYLHDLEGKLLDGNRAAEELVGCRKEDLIGKSFLELDLLCPEDLQRAALSLAKSQQGEQTGPEEFTLRRADGTTVAIETRTFPIKIKDQVLVLGIVRDISERKRAEAELRSSEERFRSVWEKSADGMRLTDGEGRIVAVNEAYCRLTKFSRAELVGKRFGVVYHSHGPNDGPEDYNRRFLTGDITPRLTARVKLWNGEHVDLDISSSFVEFGTNRLILSIFRDISERVRSERQRLAFANLGNQLSAVTTVSEASRTIMEVARDLIGYDACTVAMYLSEEDKIRYVLTQAVIDGRQVDLNVGSAKHELCVIARRVLAEGGLLLSGPELQRLELRIPNIGENEGSLLVVPMRKGTSVLGMLCVQSRSEKGYDQRSLETLQALGDHCGAALHRIWMQEELERAQRKLDHLFSQSPAVIYSLDVKGDQVTPSSVSSHIERLLGFTPEECCRPGWWEQHVHAEDAAKLRETNKQLLETGHINRDHRIRHKNGEYRWVHDEMRLIYDGLGTPVEIVGSWVDITELKALEDQLRQSQKLEAIGQLAGGIAHDFNNMLAVIRGNTDLVLMDADQLAPDARESLEQIGAACERAANLTRQLLVFSRKQSMQAQPVLLNDVVGNLTKMLKRIIGEQIDLQCEYDSSLAQVNADPGMLEQVILNLVVNARDAMMPSGGRLNIRTESVLVTEAQAQCNSNATPGEYALLTVTDTGSGIPPENLSRVFDPFFTTKDVGKGTGLGLATVYGIVKQHKGWINVESEEGRGTTFRIYFPSIPAPKAPAVSPPTENLKGGNETILLVEDELPVRLTFRRVLENYGYKVIETKSAVDALELWPTHKDDIDLLVTDIVMPNGLSGRDLVERLRIEKPTLKAIMMSGYNDEVIGSNTEFLRRTRSWFLQKPASTRTLLQTVRHCFDDPSKATGGEAPPLRP